MDIKKHKINHWYRAIERQKKLFMIQHEGINKEGKV